MNWHRQIYLLFLFASAPFFVWTSFEMYGLTFKGLQMLFYSITHSMPVLLGVVSLSAIVFLLLYMINLAYLFLIKNDGQYSLSKNAVIAVLVAQTIHTILLVT